MITVVCVDISDSSWNSKVFSVEGQLTLHKKYIILDEMRTYKGNTEYLVINDQCSEFYYSKERFMTIDEFRDKLIEDINKS